MKTESDYIAKHGRDAAAFYLSQTAANAERVIACMEKALAGDRASESTRVQLREKLQLNRDALAVLRARDAEAQP
jgi:hypothetical protein